MPQNTRDCLPTQASLAGPTLGASAWADGTPTMQMRVKGCRTCAQASDRNLSCDVGVAVISLISSSRFSIIVFMASRADSLARSFSAHLQKTKCASAPWRKRERGRDDWPERLGRLCVLGPSALQQEPLATSLSIHAPLCSPLQRPASQGQTLCTPLARSIEEKTLCWAALGCNIKDRAIAILPWPTSGDAGAGQYRHGQLTAGSSACSARVHSWPAPASGSPHHSPPSSCPPHICISNTGILPTAIYIRAFGGAARSTEIMCARQGVHADSSGFKDSAVSEGAGRKEGAPIAVVEAASALTMLSPGSLAQPAELESACGQQISVLPSAHKS